MIIGITGAAQCGKDTLALAIRDNARGRGRQLCEVRHFADALRDVVEAVFGCRYETAQEKAFVDAWWHLRIGGSSLFEGQLVNGRAILQRVGTELFRERVHPDIWLFAMERRVKTNEHLVIADVRFDNEAKWVQDQGGFVAHLTRAAPIERAALTATEQAHASEAGVSHRYVDEWHTCRSREEVEGLGRDLAIRLLGAEPFGITKEGE